MLTTQPRADIIDLKPKMKENKNCFQSKTYVFCTLVSRNVIVELVSKERAFPVRCCIKHTKLDGSNFHKWASIAPTESCVTYLTSDCPSKPTKILKAITFSKKRFGFQSTQISDKLLFNLGLVLRISGFTPVLF